MDFFHRSFSLCFFLENFNWRLICLVDSWNFKILKDFERFRDKFGEKIFFVKIMFPITRIYITYKQKRKFQIFTDFAGFYRTRVYMDFFHSSFLCVFESFKWRLMSRGFMKFQDFERFRDQFEKNYFWKIFFQ